MGKENNPQKHLFILDVDHIQDYIFSTNRLKTIIGASRLLDKINADEAGETFRLLGEPCFGFEKGGSSSEIRSSDNFIFSAGGNTKVLFPSGDNARAFDKEIRKTYEGYGISVTTLIYPVEDEKSFIENTLRPAERILAQKK